MPAPTIGERLAKVMSGWNLTAHPTRWFAHGSLVPRLGGQTDPN